MQSTRCAISTAAIACTFVISLIASSNAGADFLPFTCGTQQHSNPLPAAHLTHSHALRLPLCVDRCKLMFCLDHRTYKDHSCTAEPVGASSGGSGSGAKAGEEFKCHKYKCALPSCGAAERFDIKCPDCSLQLCMKCVHSPCPSTPWYSHRCAQPAFRHRNALDHDCAASKKAVTGQKKRAEDFLGAPNDCCFHCHRCNSRFVQPHQLSIEAQRQVVEQVPVPVARPRPHGNGKHPNK